MSLVVDDTVYVKLQSNDGKEFKVPLDAIKVSETVRNLMEDAGIEDVIPLPNVTGEVLESVILYCVHHMENPTPVSEEDKKDEKRTDDITPWDLEFCKVEQDRLFEYLLAANYLDIKPLLDLCCKTVANMIKGKTPEEIRATFNIDRDFTPEEEEQVRKENEWVEQR